MKPETIIRFLFLLFCSSFAAQAATHVWSGNGSNDLFTTSANWSSGGVPAVGELGVVLLQFPAGSASLTPIDNIPGLVVDGITFAGGNYTLGGSGGAKLTLKRSTGFSIMCTASNNLPVTINATLPLVVTSTARVQTDYRLFFDSTISGIGGIIIEGGDVYMRGTTSNTYAFTTTVQGATLWLEKSNGLASIGGDLLVDGGAVINQGNYQLGLTLNITLTNGGLYDPGTFLQDLPALHFDQGTLRLTANSGVVLYGDVTVTESGGAITGYLGLKEPARIIDVEAGGTLTVAKLANRSNPAAGLNKTGPGSLVLSGANTFTGDVTISGGSCYAKNSAALGAGNGAISVSASATLHFQGSGLSFPNKVLHLIGTVDVASDVIWNGSIAPFGTTPNIKGDFGPGGPWVMTVNGVVVGEGKLTKGGTCRLVLAGNAANTYSGGTQIIGGELSLAKTSGNAIPGALQIDAGSVSLSNNNQISDASAVVIHGGLLDLGARADTIGTLAGTGGEVKTTMGTLTTGDAGTTTYSGLLSGHGVTNIIKQGTGTFILNNVANGGDTLTGAIAINQGTLQMDGLHPGPITVNSDGILTGSGTVGAVTVLGGKVCLCKLKTQNLHINGANSQLLTTINFGNHDQINVTGTVNLNGSALSASLMYVPYVSSSFLLLENDDDDAIIGTFSGLPEGSAVILGTQVFLISYLGGTGNDILLTLVSGGRPPLLVTKFTTSPVVGNPAANTILIEASGQPAAIHIIESSDELIYWNETGNTPVTTDSQGHSSASFFDVNLARRFYRIKEVSVH